jgi:hypothetical protein
LGDSQMCLLLGRQYIACNAKSQTPCLMANQNNIESSMLIKIYS